MSFLFNLQLFAETENPHTIQGTEFESGHTEMTAFLKSYPTGFTKNYNRYDAPSGARVNLTRWFSNNIPDIKTINSLYDSISPYKTFFDDKVVTANVLSELFFKTNFTNTDEINKIISRIFTHSEDSYKSVELERIFMGINMDHNETNDTYHVKEFPNNFKLKPKLNTELEGIIIRYCMNDNETYFSTIFGGAFVDELDVSEIKINKNFSSGQFANCLFRGCIAQKVKGLETFPFENYSYTTEKTFEGLFNLDRYIDKIDDPVLKKKIKQRYYNNIDVDKENYDPIFEYWKNDKPLVIKSLGNLMTKSDVAEDYNRLAGSFSGSRRLLRTFANAYINTLELTEDVYLRYCYSYESMFEGASIRNLKIGSKIGAINRYMGSYKNMLKLSTKGPFKLESINVTFVFPDKKYLSDLPRWAKRVKDPNWLPTEPDTAKQAELIKDMLPNKDAISPGAYPSNINIRLVNFNFEDMLKFVQDNGYPEITTEDQLLEFMGGCPRQYLQFEEKTRSDYMVTDHEAHGAEA